MKFFIFLLISGFLSTNALGFFSSSSKFEVYKENVPVNYIRNENDKCAAFALNHNGQSTYSYKSQLSNYSLESEFCERMFSAKAIDFFTKRNKSSPAEFNNFEMPELIHVDDLQNIEFKPGIKSKSRFKSSVTDKTESNFPYKSKEDIKRSAEQSYQSVVIKNRDFYLSFSSYHSSFYKSGKEFKVLRSFINKSNDWEEVLYLNVWAKNLWDELVTTLGAQEARLFYFNLENKIVDNKIQTTLKEKIRLFHMAVRSYLETTMSFDTGGLSLLRNYHPLFVQVLIESLADFNHFYNNIIKQHYNKDYVLDMMKYLLILTEDEIFPDFDGQIVTSLIDENKGKLRRYVNTILFLNLVEENCHSLGLWPGASRWVVDIFERTIPNTSYSNNPISYLIKNITSKAYKACGDFSPYVRFNFWGGTPLKYWEEGMQTKKQDFRDIYKKLFNRF